VLPYFQVDVAGVKAFATITFGVVYAVLPRGKPAGYVKPVGSKYGCDWSSPSSMMAIFSPPPLVASVGPQTAGAPITCGPRALSE
jgi:hypothetical protein